MPTCPGWTAAKLAKHLGITHRWAEFIVRTRPDRRLETREIDAALPENTDAYPQWLAAGGQLLVATLRAAGPDVPTWTWAGNRDSGWWARRMLHETTVHRADAELAAGTEPAIDQAVAVDGISEFLSNLPYGRRPAPRLAGLLARQPADGQTLHLHATDADGEWMITLKPAGYSWERGHGKGAVAVRATAAELLLLVYGRLPPAGPRLAVFGDAALLADWQASTAL